LGFGQSGLAADSEIALSLEEVIVTARQREESLQDTPLSIAAVSAETLSEMGVDTVIDLDAKVPSLQFGNTSVRLQTYTGIRGIGDYSRNPGYDNRVGIYLDGVLMGRSAATDYPIVDIERIEVLRGPQGTLFGKDALSGVINISTKKPDFSDEVKAKMSLGSRNLVSGAAVVNMPISETVSTRIALAGKGQDGYYNNTYDKNKLGGGTWYAGRGQVRWLVSDKTVVDFNADAVRDDAEVILGGTPLDGPGVAFSNGDRRVSFNHSTRRVRDISGFGLNIEHQLEDFVLTSITGYRKSENTLTGNDFDLSPLEQGSNNLHDESDAFSQEIRLESPDYERFNYVLGAFYYDQQASSYWWSSLGPDFPLSVLTTEDSTVDTKIGALFGHATWRPLDAITLDVGLRYNYTDKKIDFTQVAEPDGALGFISIIGFKDSLSEGSLDPMGSITWALNDEINVYATYSSAKRPGGWNADIVQTRNLKFEEESAENYEAGFKSELFDRRLRLNLSVYSMKVDDYQVTQLGREPGQPTVTPQLTNAGKVSSEGVELDFESVLSDGFKIGRASCRERGESSVGAWAGKAEVVRIEVQQ